jgi:hypothetical protein
MSDSKTKFEHVFESVQALYAVVKSAQQDHGLPVRRATLRSNGEVIAESIDFLCDVELKAKRILPPVVFVMFSEGLDIPFWWKSALGRVFNDCRLGVGGDYKSLYYHVKQVMRGQTLSGVEFGTIVDTTPSLEDYDRRPN